MSDPARLVRAAWRRLRGVSVTALVGPSGSGKSFRARLVAERDGTDLIVDDGLLVQDDAILAGHWSKKERTGMAATRRALFAAPDHAAEAREALRRTAFRRVLIVATSRRMAVRIARRLALPRPSRVIEIGEIAGAGERAAAGRGRQRVGSHAAPVPLASIGRGPLASLADRLGGLLGRIARPAGRSAVKRIDGPPGLAPGRVRVSVAALRGMVRHCVAEHDRGIEVRRVSVRSRAGLHDLEVGIRLPPGSATAGDLHRLREYILHALERHAGVLVREVNLVVEEVGG